MGMFTETDIGDIIVVNETDQTLILTTRKRVQKYRDEIIEACKEASKSAIDSKCINMNNCRCVVCTINKVKFSNEF